MRVRALWTTEREPLDFQMSGCNTFDTDVRAAVGSLIFLTLVLLIFASLAASKILNKYTGTYAASRASVGVSTEPGRGCGKSLKYVLCYGRQPIKYISIIGSTMNISNVSSAFKGGV